MSIDFLIKALPKSKFDELLELTDRELANRHAKWITTEVNPGYPCRVSLIDANVGEKVLVLPFTHHDVASPYRASGPIFVRENAKTAKLAINKIPKMLRHRLLSVRAYNSQSIMIGAEVLQGNEIEAVIERQLQNSDVEYLHIHNANPGCFNCSVYRA